MKDFLNLLISSIVFVLGCSLGFTLAIYVENQVVRGVLCGISIMSSFCLSSSLYESRWEDILDDDYNS